MKGVTPLCAPTWRCQAANEVKSLVGSCNGSALFKPAPHGFGRREIVEDLDAGELSGGHYVYGRSLFLARLVAYCHIHLTTRPFEPLGSRVIQPATLAGNSQ